MKKTIRNSLRPIYYRVWHRRTFRHCPICGRISKSFLEHGIIPRQDARCPSCGSLERHRLLWLFLERKTDFFRTPPKKALHVAPERVIEAKLRNYLGDRYLTADLHSKHVDVRMDITDIQFEDKTFDFIYCSHVLEHVPDDRKAMREFRRVLTDDGLAVLLVPISEDKTFEDPTVVDPEERLRLFGQEDHVRLYGPDYKDRLEEAGFQVQEIQPGDFLDGKSILRMGITQTAGSIFVCRRTD